MIKARLSCCLFICAIIGLPAESYADYAEFAATQYLVELWPNIPSHTGQVVDWVPSLEMWSGEGRTIVTNWISAKGAHIGCFDLVREDGLTMDLRTYSCSTFHQAKEFMLEDLGMMQSTVPLQSGTNGLDRLGDICYADLSSKPLVLFIRNNVFVSCLSSFDNTELTNLLFSTDSQIISNLMSEQR